MSQPPLEGKTAAGMGGVRSAKQRTAIKAIEKDIRSVNYLITQADDYDTMYYLMCLRKDLLRDLKRTRDVTEYPDLSEDVQKQLEINHLKNAKRYNRLIETPIEEQNLVVETEPNVNYDIQLATARNRHLKETHHHYVGFYSNKVLPAINGNEVTIAGKKYKLDKEPHITYGKSGDDTIVSEVRTITTNDKIPLGTIVYNKAKQPVSMIHNTGKKYAIQDGFTRTNIHLTKMTIDHQIKDKPIAYADKQFQNKQQLVDYLSLPDPIRDLNPNIHATIYTSPQLTNAQLIIHEAGRNIANLQLRHPLLKRK